MVALSATLWGTIPLLVRNVSAPAVVVVFWRLFFAAAAVAPMFALRPHLRRELADLPRRAYGALALQGALLALNWVLFFTALKFAPVAVAELLAYCGPVFVAALTPLLSSDRFDRRIVLPLVLALAGIVVILGPNRFVLTSPAALLGAACAFASALTYAGLILNGKRLLQGFSSAVYMFVESVVAAILLLPAVFFLPHPEGATEWLSLVALGAVLTAGTGFLFVGALRDVRADRVAVLTYLEPASAVVFAALFLGEPLTLPTLVGGVLVIAAGVIVARLAPEETGAMEAPEFADAREGRLRAEPPPSGGYTASTEPWGGTVTKLQQLRELRALDRLREGDPTLFSDDQAEQKLAAGSLGFTTLAREASAHIPDLVSFAEEIRAEGTTDIVLLGMGGSALAPLVIASVIGPVEGWPRLHVLDTTAPETVLRAVDELDPAKTLWVVASKSGGTIEPNTLYAIFRDRADAALGHSEAGQRFVAITDPGSSLEALAGQTGFRRVFLAKTTVGGRFSAISMFGLLPAALIGVDLETFVERALTTENHVAETPIDANNAAALASIMVGAQEMGVDKLTVVTSPALASFGPWVDQLVAESLGKHGTGVIPIIELAENPDPSGYADDRLLAVVRYAEDATLAEWCSRAAVERALVAFELNDAYDIAAQFVVWEWAVALAGALLGVNPFGQPDVEFAKAATRSVLGGELAAPESQLTVAGVELAYSGALADAAPIGATTLADALSPVLSALRERDFLCVLAFLPTEDPLLEPLREACVAIGTATGRAVSLQLGPRYLHSTGQLYKGGPDEGVFLAVTVCSGTDTEVPGHGWTLRQLNRAQAAGDVAVLADRGRRVALADLPDASPESVALIAGALAELAARA